VSECASKFLVCFASLASSNVNIFNNCVKQIGTVFALLGIEDIHKAVRKGDAIFRNLLNDRRENSPDRLVLQPELDGAPKSFSIYVFNSKRKLVFVSKIDDVLNQRSPRSFELLNTLVQFIFKGWRVRPFRLGEDIEDLRGR
jgi:hypothetical protein